MAEAKTVLSLLLFRWTLSGFAPGVSTGLAVVRQWRRNFDK